MKRYERNRIYISESVQKKIRDFRLLFAGVGIGSHIAETALRMGFEHITLVDGEVVQTDHLNNQNYRVADVGRLKAEVLKDHFLDINPDAQIEAVPIRMNSDNVPDIVAGHHAAVNTLDFDGSTPFVFDRICSEQGITVLHPFNVGFAGIVMVTKPNQVGLDSLLPEGESPVGFERHAVRHATDYFNYWARPKMWIEEMLRKYEDEGCRLPPPRLAVASSLVAGMSASILYRLAVGGFVKSFPKFYYYSEYDDLN